MTKEKSGRRCIVPPSLPREHSSPAKRQPRFMIPFPDLLPRSHGAEGGVALYTRLLKL